MFIRHELILDTRGVHRHSKRIQQSTRALEHYVAKTVVPASQKRTNETINVEPGSPHYPIRWQSEKQRKAYFASNGFGHGIPYKRSGKVRSWKIIARAETGQGVIAAVNPAAHAKFVFGPYQQKMHKPTWMNIETYRSVESNALVRDVMRGWVQVNEA